MIYRVYADHNRRAHIVKRGFSWPAFLGPEIWLFLRGLPLEGTTVLALMVLSLVVEPPEIAGWWILAIRIIAGLVANQRIESRYRSQGWQRVTEVEAKSVTDALNKVSTVPSPAA